MLLQNQYPLTHHPCFSSQRQDLWARIHLPVAKRCNVKCIFCDHQKGASCHTSRPGYSAGLMSPSEAIDRTREELHKNSNLKIVAISGPGEPLYNEETFEVLERIQDLDINCKLCLSTNGVLLSEKADVLVNLGVESVSVSMSGINSEVVARIYEWAIVDGTILRDLRMAKQIYSRQLKGIQHAFQKGLIVKVNTILIPGLNTVDIQPLAEQISSAGAVLQNIVPLVPYCTSEELRSPTPEELETARIIGSEFIPQFYHCRQCRSDVVGIPGNDRIL